MGVTSVSPESDVVRTPALDSGEGLINIVEDFSVAPFPDVPHDSSADRGVDEVVAPGCPKVVHIIDGRFSGRREEEVPNFFGFGAAEQEMIRVFNLGAAGTGWRGPQLMTEAPLVGG